MYIKDISHFPIQFAVDIILLLLPSSLVYTLRKLLHLSWGFFVTYVQKIVYHFLQKSLILLQPISKHTKHTTVAYFWRDKSFIYT